MKENNWTESPHFGLALAILIAIVSATIALATWRINMVSSSAGDASRQGLLDAIKKQAFTNENWRETYSEANSAVIYASTLAEVNAMEASGDPVAAAQAINIRQYLLPNLQLMASPLASEPNYQKSDGTYDLQKRFTALEAESPDLQNLDPQTSFQIAGWYYSEQRWLTVATVVLTISLFWLALAEIGGKRLRLLTLIIGAGIFALGLVNLAVVEVVFYFLRGGAL